MSHDERERLERFRRGEPGAFDDLYAEYGRRVYRFCLRLCGGATADAEDLTQDVFVAAYRNLHRFEGRSTVSTYLYKIAYYRWRQVRSAGVRELAFTSCGEGGGGWLAGGDPTGSQDPARRGVARMTLNAALATLSDAQRAAFLLVKAEGLTCREAAEALGVPVGTVKYQVFEAVAHLRSFLEGGDDHAV